VRGADNRIYWRRMDSYGSWSAWTAVPTGLTDASPSIAFFNGRLYCAVKGYGSNAIYLNSMDTGTFVWSGWTALPGATPNSPALTAYGYLYIAVRGTNNRIYWQRMDYLGAWSGWSAVPTGSTDASPSIAYCDGRLYCAVKGYASNAIYLNSMDTGTFVWSGWTALPGATPNSPILSSPRYDAIHLYIAVRGTDNRIYWRRVI